MNRATIQSELHDNKRENKKIVTNEKGTADRHREKEKERVRAKSVLRHIKILTIVYKCHTVLVLMLVLCIHTLTWTVVRRKEV